MNLIRNNISQYSGIKSKAITKHFCSRFVSNRVIILPNSDSFLRHNCSERCVAGYHRMYSISPLLFLSSISTGNTACSVMGYLP